MNSSPSRLLIFTFFLSFATLLFSCTKITTTDIGSGLIPPADDVTTKDTVLDVITKNAGYDTTYVGISDDHILGYTNDNIFGTTLASVNFQVSPSFLPFSFGLPKDSILLDSVVLCLSYHTAWGDTLAHLKLHVYSMDPENVFDNNVAYNNKKIFEKGPELTEFNAAKDVNIPLLKVVDTTDHYGEPTTYQLRIKLDNSFGQKLIGLDSAAAFQSDSTFYNYLRGLIVEPEASGNALMVVNLLDTNTRLSLYYRSKDLKDTLTRRFPVNVLTAASSNTILRSYQGTQIPSFISSADTNDNLIFMQTTPGTYASLKIPGLSKMPNVIVHRAEVLMYQVPDLTSGDDNLFTPPNLFLATYSKDSAKPFVVPYDITFSGSTISNLTQFGVSPKSQTDKNTGLTTSYYSFDISRYVQSIVTKQNTVYDFRLYAPYNQYISPTEESPYVIPIATPALNTVGIGRVRLGGGNNSQYKMRLHIVYSLP